MAFLNEFFKNVFEATSFQGFKATQNVSLEKAGSKSRIDFLPKSQLDKKNEIGQIFFLRQQY